MIAARPDRLKMRAVIGLSLVLACLVVARLSLGSLRTAGTVDTAVRGTMDSAIDAALKKRGLDPRMIRTRDVVAGGVRTGRRESTVAITSAFPCVTLNHDLAVALAPFGARVIAAEHGREETVSLHVRLHGRIFRTLVLHTEGR